MTNIRRGQLITTHGIGSIITDKDNENFLVLTTDAWVYLTRAKYIVDEPRLQNYLGVKTLIQPPPAEKKKGPDGRETVKEFIKAIRFPTWHFCSNPHCKTLQKVGYEEMVGGCINKDCNNRKANLVPVRFLSVCENGHIDDFPFQEWVHGDRPHEGHVLQYDEWAGKTGLAGINIKCMTCGKQKTMQGALSPDSLKNIKSCPGLRPWLYKGRAGRKIEESCDKPLQGAQKAASNVYIPVIRNSIFIPKHDDFPPDISDFMNNQVFVDTVKGVINDKAMALLVIKNLGRLNDAEANIVYNLLNNGPELDIDYNDIKEVEYAAFKRGSIQKSNDFDCTPLPITGFDDWFQEYFSSVSLVEKLRDTRAQVGFTRVKPFDELDRNVRSLIKQISPSNELPADVVRGEGIFLEFNPITLGNWGKNESLSKRLKNLPAAKLSYLERMFKDPAAFMMIHSFSHILINELCLVSGYNNSSIKERVYSTSIHGNTMHGLLIYTNSGDSEGSLGGLVRNGKPDAFEPLVLSALQKADWCSSDPVCGEVIPQGHEGSNLAACHNCCLLPETACENMNVFLDRGLLRGSLSDHSFGYFNNLKI